MLKDEGTKKVVTVTRKRGAPKAQSKEAVGGGDGSIVTHQEYRAMVAEAAYFLAEQRGFTEDGVTDDWLKAEELIQMRLR